MTVPARELLAGGLAGGVATGLMSAWMLLAERLGLEGEQPPEAIVEAGLDALGVSRSETMENALASVLHLLFGVANGVVYRLLRRRWPTPGPRVLHGVGYGLGVWATSYYGWIPAAGVLPPPHHDDSGRAKTMLLAHVLYGGVLGALAEPDQAR